jgi:siroheme synthase
VENRVAEEGVRPPAIVVVGDVVNVAAEIAELMRDVTA